MALPKKIINTSSAGSVRGKSLLVSNNSELKHLWGKNVGAAAFYLHFVDALAIPADGVVVHKINPIMVGAGFEFDVDLEDLDVVFKYGMCIYASSTEYLKTLIVADDMIATAIYIEDSTP
jgi:hypothetical protein